VQASDLTETSAGLYLLIALAIEVLFMNTTSLEAPSRRPMRVPAHRSSGPAPQAKAVLLQLSSPAIRSICQAAGLYCTVISKQYVR
jgi:hypothetical protein